MKKIFAVLALFLFKVGYAQVGTEGATQTSSVIVHKDPRVDLLTRKKSELNKASKKAADRTMRGYRLMVINTNSRDEAIAAKQKIYTYYPELKSYLQYQTPYFKLKVGNFKTRPEAEKYRKTMASMFPKGVFIINDIIEVKGERDPEETDE